MKNSIPNWLRTTFLAHWILGGLLGAGLLLLPGRVLALLGWVPENVAMPGLQMMVPGTTFVDPVLIRLLGAALLGLAWASFRGWRAKQRSEVELILQVEVIFCVLGAVAAIAGITLLEVDSPFIASKFIGYVLIAVLVLFGAAWGLALRRSR